MNSAQRQELEFKVFKRRLGQYRVVNQEFPTTDKENEWLREIEKMSDSALQTEYYGAPSQ